MLAFSCSHTKKIYHTRHINPNIFEYVDDCHSCMYIILDKSLSRSKVFIRKSNNLSYALFKVNENDSSLVDKDTTYLNYKPNNNSNIDKYVKVNNFRALDVFVDNDSLLIRDFTFSQYRYVVLKKNIAGQKKFIFTNNILDDYRSIFFEIGNNVYKKNR
jgi:hypothetical protein